MLSFGNLYVANRLDGITANAKQGEFVHLIGANGAGKSSLLNVAAGILSADTGKVTLNNRDIAEYDINSLANVRCFQQQQPTTQFALTVKETLQFFASADDVPEQLEKALEIKQFFSRPLSELSGGEARRVHIARALLQIWPVVEQGKAVVLLDEPIQGLDFRHQHLLFGCLNALAKLGNTIICSHHDINLCANYASSVWLLKSGQLLSYGKPDLVLTEANLSAAYSCAFYRFIGENGEQIFQSHLD